MLRHQGKGILLGLDSRKESTVCSFLETDKLKQAYTLPIHPLPHTGELQHIKVGKICFNGTRSIYCLANIAEKEHGSFRLLGQPALGQTSKCRRRQLLLQSPPDTTSLLLIGHHGKQPVVEQRKRLSFLKQRIGKGTAGIGFEHGSQQSLKRMVIQKNIHSSKLSTNCLSSTFLRSGLGSSRLRTPCGVSSLTVCIGNSQQVMKYCAFFITTPIFFNW